MQEAKESFDRRGIAVAVVSFAPPERLAGYQRIHRWPFILLADPTRAAYRHFGLGRLSLRRVFSLDTLKVYFNLLRRGRRLESYGRDDYFQAGGDFLLDRDGRLLFSHPSRDPADRPPVSRLLAEADARR